MKVKHKLYYHSDKSDMRYQFDNICEEHGYKPSEDAIERAVYAGYEIAINVEWDLETGACKVLGTCD